MKIIVLSFLLIIFCSCGRNNTIEKGNAESVLKIDLLSEPESTVKKLSEFATCIEYIPLQTLEGSLISGQTRKIIDIDKRIYIQNNDEILCFDMDGKYLFKLQNRGRGPKEYTFLDDFDVSSDNRFLILLSTSRLLIYGISEKGFTFQRSIPLKDPAPLRVSIVPQTDYAFLLIAPWRGTEPTLSLLINTTGDTIHFKPNCYKYKMVNKINYRASNEGIAYSTGVNVCFKERFSDTVFYVDAKGNFSKPRIIFDSHGTTMSPEMRGGSETPGNNITYIANLFETSRYVFYRYFTMKTQNALLFDRKTNTKHKLYKLGTESEPKSALKDDLSGGPDFNIEFLKYYCSGGKLFSFAEVIALKRYVASDDFKNAQLSDAKRKNELKILADFLKETDNPCLIIITPKE